MASLVSSLYSLPWEALISAIIGTFSGFPPSLHALGAIELKLETLVPISTWVGVNLASVRLPRFQDFARLVARSMDATPIVLLGALILVERLKTRLTSKAVGNRETIYRVFVASLIISSKMIHDVPPRNSAWVYLLAPWFPGHEINQMERQLIQFLDYEITLRLADLECVVLSDASFQSLLFASPINFSASLGCDSEDAHLSALMPLTESRARLSELFPHSHTTTRHLRTCG